MKAQYEAALDELEQRELEQYEDALCELEALIRYEECPDGSPEAIQVDKLAAFIEDYEKEHFPPQLWRIPK